MLTLQRGTDAPSEPIPHERFIVPVADPLFDLIDDLRISGARTAKEQYKARGWVLNHKTGTGQVLGDQQAGYNDIGILTAPDGKSYAVAVMIKLTSVPLPVRMTLMNNVVRAVIAQHDMQYASVAQQ